MRWLIFRSKVKTPQYVRLRAMEGNRWVSPAILCTTVESACALAPKGADVSVLVHTLVRQP